jgi:hypothetical protein
MGIPRNNLVDSQQARAIRKMTHGAVAWITTKLIKDLAVTTAKIAANAVTTAKLADLSVTTGKIVDLAVTTAKIAANAVTLGKLGALTTKGDVLTHDGTDHKRFGVGSNGQVLTADSAQANGIKWASVTITSPLTTKGDVYTFSTVDARLPVGSNGQVLSADSTAATGLKWIAASAGFTSPLTTKGDLHGFSTVDIRVGVGADDTILAADSTQASGLQYQTFNHFVGFSAKGDLLTTGDGSTMSRHPVGNDHEFLIADSTASRGLRWGTIMGAQKGYLLTSAGAGDVGMAPGSNGQILIADSTAGNGLRWGAIGSANSGIAYSEQVGTNAATDDIGASSTAQNNFTLSAALFGYTFGANTLTAGSTWRLTLAGTRDLGAISRCRLRVYFGNQSVLICDSDDNQSTITTGTGSNLGWQAEVIFRIVSAGAAGTVRGNGWGDVVSGVNSSQNCFRSSKSGTVDTTASQQLTASWTFSASNAGNKVRIHQYVLERLS